MKLLILLSLSITYFSSGQDVSKCEKELQLGMLRNVSSFSVNSGVGVFYGLDDKDTIKYIIITDIKEMNKIIFVRSIGGHGKKTTLLNVQIDQEMTPQKLSEFDLLLFQKNKFTRFPMSDKISNVRFAELLKNSKDVEDFIKSLK
jgi:hypothetical protein